MRYPCILDESIEDRMRVFTFFGLVYIESKPDPAELLRLFYSRDIQYASSQGLGHGSSEHRCYGYNIILKTSK